MLEVARRVVSDADRKRPTGARPRGSEELTHIAYTRAHFLCLSAPFGIILKQVAVFLHDGAAASRIDRDEPGPRLLERRDVTPRELPRVVEIAGMRVQSAATLLPRRGDHGVAVHGQDALRRP